MAIFLEKNFLSSRLNQLFKSIGISVRQAEIAVGAGNGTIGRCIRGKGDLGSFWIAKIISTWNVNPSWLLTGEGEMFLNATKPAITDNKPLAVPAARGGVPLVGEEALAGMGSFTFAIEQQNIQAYYHVPDFHDVHFMIRVTGDSMSPTYKAGDIIACRQLSSIDAVIVWGRIYLIASRSYGILVKRLRPGKDKNHFLCLSDNNEEYPPFHLHKKNEISHLAIVMGGIRLE